MHKRLLDQSSVGLEKKIKIHPHFSNAVFEIITKTLNARDSTVLELDYRGINEEGVIALANILQGTWITRLNLGYNTIQDKGAMAIANVLQHSQIESLNLSYNDIEDEGLQAIADVLKETKITHLDLTGNDFDPDEIQDFVYGLSDSQVIDLNLTIHIDMYNCFDISTALKNTNVISFRMEPPNYPPDFEYMSEGEREQMLANTITETCRENKRRMNTKWKELKNLLSKKNGMLEFKIFDEQSKPSRYIELMRVILMKKHSYMNYFSDQNDETFTKEGIRDFVKNIEKRLAEFFSKLEYSCVEHTKLLLLCEKEGLSAVVELLLDHRPNYILIDNILHPAVCILMEKYGKPWYFENMKPTRAELIETWNDGKLDDLLQEDRLMVCSCRKYTKKAMLAILQVSPVV